MLKTKEEILADVAKQSEILGDAVIPLLADISDSMGSVPDMSQYVPKAEHEKLRNEYIARFTGAVATPPAPETETPPVEDEEDYNTLLGIKE